MSTRPPAIDIRVLTVPKEGHRAEENEDAAAYAADTWPVRVAIADGATEAVFSGLWAEMLVARWVADDGATPAALAEALPAWRNAWQNHPAVRSQDLPWYAAAKAADGAHATLLGLTLRANGTWKSVAVGDGVLMHLREGRLERAWPMDDPEAFSDRPALLASVARPSPPRMEAASGDWAPGDSLLLTTDAVAAWLLRTDPTAAPAWDAASFAEQVESARTQGLLRNDDSTLVQIST